jgi:hypothetical protein
VPSYAKTKPSLISPPQVNASHLRVRRGRLRTLPRTGSRLFPRSNGPDLGYALWLLRRGPGFSVVVSAHSPWRSESCADPAVAAAVMGGWVVKEQVRQWAPGLSPGVNNGCCGGSPLTRWSMWIRCGTACRYRLVQDHVEVPSRQTPSGSSARDAPGAAPALARAVCARDGPGGTLPGCAGRRAVPVRSHVRPGAPWDATWRSTRPRSRVVHDECVGPCARGRGPHAVAAPVRRRAPRCPLGRRARTEPTYLDFLDAALREWTPNSARA